MTTLFQFEREDDQEYHCIPMQVRLKLDSCGLKVTTQQWHCLFEEEQHLAALMPCQTVEERRNYRELIGGIILGRTGQPAREMPTEASPAWLDEHSIPKLVQDAFSPWGGRELTLGQWSHLTPLQRFALIKLTRPGHDMKSKFAKALKEFGLVDQT